MARFPNLKYSEVYKFLEILSNLGTLIRIMNTQGSRSQRKNFIKPDGYWKSGDRSSNRLKGTYY